MSEEFLGASSKRYLFWIVVILWFGPSFVCSQNKAPDAVAGKGKAPAGVSDQSSARPDAVLSGQMSRTSAGPGEAIRFWITIENRTDRPLEKIWLEHLDVPGFAVVRRCWSDGQADPACHAKDESAAEAIRACAPSGQQLPASELCEALAPRQTLTVWGDVQFVAPAARSLDFAVLRWASGTVTSRAVVPLGQVESLGRLRSLWEAITGDWQIGVPVWIAIFSGLYALWKSWHQGRAAKQATEFEQRRHTWNLLLLKVHRLAFQHYMPIVSTVQGALLYFQRLRINEGTAQDNLLGAFCYILRFHWRMRRMKRSGASWYFKDLTAEELVVALVQTHRRSLGLSDLRRQAALDEFLEDITEDTTVSGLLAALPNISEAQAKFWNEFREWMAGIEARHDADLLSAMTKIINYETNRPYYYWYEELRAIVWTDGELNKIREITRASEGGQTGISARVEKYLKVASSDQTLK